MSKREKMLALSIGVVVLLFAAILGMKALLLKPLREIDKKTAAAREKLDKIAAERRAYFSAEELVKKFSQRAFDDDLDEASSKSGEILTRQILLSGLAESDFSRLPVGPRKLHGASEIGWSIQGEGKLANVVNLIFLLQESPFLHRIENLVLSSGDAPGRVRVRFRYLTLIMEPAQPVDPIDLEPKLSLDSPERGNFDPIVTRDILRPYIKRPLPGTPGTAPQTPNSSPGPPSTSDTLRVVSLSEWKGEPEVHVRDSINQKTLRYRPGDTLAGGTIVMIDYRPLPLPGNEAIKSFSRVILKMGSEYCAIERGKTLAEKYRLAPEHLPEQLSKL